MKSSQAKRLLLFDIDGTLVDTAGAGVRSLRKALEQEFEVDDDLDGIEIAGRTDSGIVQQILQKQNIEATPEATAAFLNLYVKLLAEELPERKGRILPGIAELLPRLQARPHNVLGLLTGNIERGAELKLSHHGIWDFFELGAFADDHHDRNRLGPFAQERARQKHALEFVTENVDVIGDTPHDIACGKAIGARTIAVTTGSFSREQLSAHEPDRILDDFSEVDAVIADLGW